jgi:hypothetical protein
VNKGVWYDPTTWGEKPKDDLPVDPGWGTLGPLALGVGHAGLTIPYLRYGFPKILGAPDPEIRSLLLQTMRDKDKVKRVDPTPERIPVPDYILERDASVRESMATYTPEKKKQFEATLRQMGRDEATIKKDLKGWDRSKKALENAVRNLDAEKNPSWWKRRRLDLKSLITKPGDAASYFNPAKSIEWESAKRIRINKYVAKLIQSTGLTAGGISELFRPSPTNLNDLLGFKNPNSAMGLAEDAGRTIGFPAKGHEAILAHEMGHARQSPAALRLGMGPLGLGMAGMSLAGWTDRKDRGKLYGALGSAALLPLLGMELDASWKGSKLLKQHGQKGFLRRLKSFGGVPTYAGMAALPYLMYKWKDWRDAYSR